MRSRIVHDAARKTPHGDTITIQTVGMLQGVQGERRCVASVSRSCVSGNVGTQDSSILHSADSGH